MKIYTVVYKFIRCFYNSKHPTTTCWLLEILHILSIKFSPKQAYSIEKKLKRDFQEVLTHLLQNAAAIVTDLISRDRAIKESGLLLSDRLGGSAG